MEENEYMKNAIFDTIENQIRQNDPPQTKKTLERLKKEGYDDFNAKNMIAHCLSLEFYDVIKNKNTFNLERYVKNLDRLPKEPE
ncbi:DUF1841 family protein [Brumimicrobium oceani]|uniref:Uncharacterized protein n=1 Tax=Brumimicrobium oceani TaxID=2100725 RepID=A0A2U2XBG5_9FLAO|nr:DUF1841 family protein [Brumimicrobium oceani]PWH85107.1 hypothetical protein DIT68_10750 [Brumimicrobium oceani]